MTGFCGAGLPRACFNVIGVLVSGAINSLHKSSDGGENLVCGLVRMKGFGSSFQALTQPRMSPSKRGYLAHESFSESIPRPS